MKATGKTAVSRLEAQRKILKAGHFFKLICGAGNEDPDEVYKLSLVYTLAGALGIDLAARADVVTAAKRGVADAKKLAPAYGLKEFIAPYLTVSVGMAGDPHVRKARILDDNCTECNACIPVCPTEAIPKSLTIIESRCIGCGACGVACQDDAIGYSHKTIAMEKVLKECIAAGAENIELHCAVPDHEQSLKEWKLVAGLLPDGFLSVCVDRGYLSNHELKKRLELMLEHARGRMIVQADGIPMSGGKDDFNTTLQAVATADIVAKMKLPVHLLLSGGTNSKTVELSKACGVPYAGASLGTYARHLVYEHLNDPAFPDEKALRPAVEKARRLVETCRPME
ncbi:MAG: 4Fe-4S binding protein [Elusimicrobia bacterium]|nr:4Fe-4S binding protein [Elusimicrobiota bacterium]